MKSTKTQNNLYIVEMYDKYITGFTTYKQDLLRCFNNIGNITQVSQVQELAFSEQVNDAIRLILVFSLISGHREKCCLLVNSLTNSMSKTCEI